MLATLEGKAGENSPPSRANGTAAEMSSPVELQLLLERSYALDSMAAALQLASATPPPRLKTRVGAFNLAAAALVGARVAAARQPHWEKRGEVRRSAMGSRKYLSPEPMLQRPGFVKVMAMHGRNTPAYAYALNNPLNYADDNGLYTLKIICKDASGKDVPMTFSQPDKKKPSCEECEGARIIVETQCSRKNNNAACECAKLIADTVCAQAGSCSPPLPPSQVPRSIGPQGRPSGNGDSCE